jgi:tetratricopeptide (TPR) repeat protein
MSGRSRLTPAAPTPPPPAAAGAPDILAWHPAGIFGLLVALVAVAYLPALSGTLLWDDAGHVTRPDLRSLAGLGRIWFEFGATQQYYPVLHSAFWLEHLLWGDTTTGYHLVNVLQHATNAFLFGLILRRLALPGAWLAAFLFALHPVCVESVAWIAEQKNTLSGLFYLGAALAYLRFADERRPHLYAWAGVLFVLALLTKSVTATLPAALLVVGWWRRGRLEWRRDVWPLLPWLVAGAASGLVTAHFEHALIGAQGADFDLGALQRVLLAGRVFWFYLGKLAWPAELIFIYPRWTIEVASGWHWLPTVAALALFGALAWGRRRTRGPLAAVLLFAGTLFPVLGFINIYPFLFSYVADHFQYLACLAIIALAAAGLMPLTARLPRRASLVASGGLIAVLGSLTWAQSGLYRDVFTLFQATLQRNPDCWMAHNNLAIELAQAGRVREAIPHLETVLRLKPDFAPAENNLGHDLIQLNRSAEAIPHLERAVRLQPKYAVAYRNLGLALATLGRTHDAIPHFREAIRLNPADAEAELSLGIALMLTGRFPDAGPHFERALRLNPQSAYFHDTYGRALAGANQINAAIEHFEQALAIDPDYRGAHLNLAQALRRLGRMEDAARHLRAAQRLGGVPPGLP